MLIMSYLIWILGILIVDQSTKAIVVKTLPPHQSVSVIQGFLNFTHVRNPGGAFGILRNYGSWVAIVTLIISLTLILMLLFAEFKDSVMKVGLAVIVGGALGNLIDRLRWGYVIDFFDFWMIPVFNLADLAIVIGTLLIIFTLLKRAGF